MNPSSPSAAPGLRGEIVCLFACDFAYDMRRPAPSSLLGAPLEPFRIDARKRGPRGQVFYRPLVAELPDEPIVTTAGPSSARLSIKLLPIGALSLTVRIPFAVPDLAALSSLAAEGFRFTNGADLAARTAAVLEAARAELAPYAIRPRPILPEGETYKVFCIDAASPGIDATAETWLATNRSAVAALLTGETAVDALSDQEIAESTARSLSYYRHDLVVADWDAALILDLPTDFPETLYIMELANIQLEELKAYDAHLDEALERAYRDLSRSGRRAGILTELKELRIDLSRFSDELSNITKFFGEWHLARVHETTARLFHLADWHRAIDEKLRTLDSFYEMLKQDRNNRVMVWLEAGIVLLFIIDLVTIFAGIGK